MSQFIQNVQVQIKRSSQSFVLFTAKLFSGFLLGLVFAIAGEEAVGYGSLAFWFVITVITLAFVKVSKPWNFGGLMVYNLVCVLLGLLLRMYILVAPGN